MGAKSEPVIFDLIVVGGGAAGFFSAINFAEFNPGAKVVILEKSKQALAKVKISGGGRCNVTHHCFNPSLLAKNYPRGNKFLKENFKTFNPEHTIKWFKEKGVELKVEPDGRMFPITDSSQTIIDCFFKEIKRLNVKLCLQTGVEQFEFTAENTWKVNSNHQSFFTKKLMVATGSSPMVWKQLKSLGLKVEPAAPSLFTFNTQSNFIKDLAGVSVEPVEVQLIGTKLKTEGPLLFTHWGFSGPAILKLSAFGALQLADCDYRFNLKINWLPKLKTQEVDKLIDECVALNPDKIWNNVKPFPIPNRLWERIVELSLLNEVKLKATQAKNKARLINNLLATIIEINGKSTFKEEFVTCGGVCLSEVDNSTLECKRFKQLYLTGEVLNIDAVTGGFNFQAAWTNAYLFAANSV
jgi:predicted Rossmann fold flavoprotein